MSLGEMLLTAIIAILVLGPTKIPMLARHLFQLKKRLDYWQQQWQTFWQEQVKKQTLLDNQQRATEADEHYQDACKKTSSPDD